MIAPLSVPSEWSRLNDEQRVLVGGRGADTRTVAEWRALLDGVARFGAVRRSAMRALVIVAALLLPLTALLVFLSVAARVSTLGFALTLVPFALVGGAWLWLRPRAVPTDIRTFSLPFLAALEGELGAGAQLWLSVRCVARAGEEDARWLEGAAELDEHLLLHFSARDVVEDGALVVWLRATVSRVAAVEAHHAGEDDPTASGMTRVAADEAAKTGNPFTSMEMLAIKTAHGIQLDLARLEAFGDLAVPPPPVGDVVGEATEKIVGGRAAAKATTLQDLWRRAAAGEGQHD
jgi:hypothetical protein